jgi:predicted dehydrogenase
MKKINIALVGLGYWGPNYLRILNEIYEVQIRYCCDLNVDKLEKIKQMYPSIDVTDDYRKIANDREVEGVIIATPLNTHYNIAKSFLKGGKHVLVEKPFTKTYVEGKDLIEIAQRMGLVLMVGHVYEFNSGIIALKEIIKKGDLGKIYYIKAERLGLGPIRKHASALWDLATHDISIVLYLLEDFPVEVYTNGGAYIQKDIEDFVNLNLKFRNNINCNINATWFAPEKVRKLIVVGSKAMVVFDDINKAEMLKIYKREVNGNLLNTTPTYYDHQNIITMGDIYIPNIKQSEPLKNQVLHFLDCIINSKKPVTDGQDGINVIKVLELAQKSIKDKRVVKCR